MTEARPWSLRDLDALKRYAHLGAREVAQLLNRSESSVRKQAARLRISLRQPGSRRGLALGQPRGVPLADLPPLADLREKHAAGDLSQTVVEERRRLLASDAPLCPTCSARPQEGPSGLCRVCYLGSLSQAHRDAIAVRDAERELRAERQRKKRAGLSSSDP